MIKHRFEAKRRFERVCKPETPWQYIAEFGLSEVCSSPSAKLVREEAGIPTFYMQYQNMANERQQFVVSCTPPLEN